MYFDQSDFEVRCEWGAQGVAQLSPISDVVIIVDVLSFSTCVEIATQRDTIVFPYRFNDGSARVFADSMGATLAERTRSHLRYSLSPSSLIEIVPGTRLVLPSPNGATLSFGTGSTPTLTACLRNYEAVAIAASQFGKRIAIIPAGERWSGGSLRPALEDLVGAGALISHLQGTMSPEARAAHAAFLEAKAHLELWLRECSSGKELIARGFEEDVRISSELNISDCAPLLIDRAYQRIKL